MFMPWDRAREVAREGVGKGLGLTSMFGRLLPLFGRQRKVEDLFTEAVATVFEKNPRLCLEWLGHEGLISPGLAGDGGGRVRVQTQKPLVATDTLESAGTVDMFVEVRRSPKSRRAEGGAAEAVMIESRIGSPEGKGQLRKYAEYLAGMEGYGRKTLLYVTRREDPKDGGEILSGLGGNVRFQQMRWHDFHRFRDGVEGDALAEEVKIFMAEQGMSRSYRFSAADLAALSGMPRAAGILAEARLTRMSLIHDNLNGARLSGADLSGATFSVLQGTAADLIEAERTGMSLDALGTPSATSSLQDADLSGAVLQSSRLTGCNLMSANLAGANLDRADLRGADLRFTRNVTQDQIDSAYGGADP
ncbi:MAG: hypothetical protein CYG60_13350 [Actinobacteria bacterium]|nr:MAG: hypothetical protein CYG60_13350 [Actinomycetota bacterium]